MTYPSRPLKATSYDQPACEVLKSRHLGGKSTTVSGLSLFYRCAFAGTRTEATLTRRCLKQLCSTNKPRCLQAEWPLRHTKVCGRPRPLVELPVHICTCVSLSRVSLSMASYRKDGGTVLSCNKEEKLDSDWQTTLEPKRHLRGLGSRPQP